jgi:hypothetical protein
MTNQRIKMAKTDVNDSVSTNNLEALRRCADMLCLWRLCANASYRRARSCRGRVHLCAKRNFGAVPDGARDFFVAFLAAKHAGLPFEAFKEEMTDSDEAAALAAWCKAAKALPR